jgi:hypothetical protein
MTNQTYKCYECNAVLLLDRFWYTHEDDMASAICEACYGEPVSWMSAEAIAKTSTQTNTNSNPLGVTDTGVTKPLSARIAQAITPSVDSQ